MAGLRDTQVAQLITCIMHNLDERDIPSKFGLCCINCSPALTDSVGFLPARKVFLSHEGEKQGESISAIVSAISAGEKWQNLLKT